jgi:hypothetical protein
MREKIKSMLGERHGMLVVERFAFLRVRAYWHCLCDCGQRIIVNRQALVTGNTRSCGCLRSISKRKKEPPKMEAPNT